MTFKHIPPHILWAHIFEAAELSADDAAHIVTCQFCQKVFRACLKSESLKAALKTLADESQCSI